MTTSADSLSSNSDNSGADYQCKHSQPDNQNQAPTGALPPEAAPPNVEFMMQHGLFGMGLNTVPAAYPYMDPYYGSIYAPCNDGQTMVHPYLVGAHPGLPLPSDSFEEPVYVNAKQYHGILRRRQSRAKAESENKLIKNRKPYLHESRHLHALKRARGCGGRFTSKNGDNQKEGTSSEDNTQSSSPSLQEQRVAASPRDKERTLICSRVNGAFDSDKAHSVEGRNSKHFHEENGQFS